MTQSCPTCGGVNNPGDVTVYNIRQPALLAGFLSIMALPASAATVETFNWTFTAPAPGGFNGAPLSGDGTITATESTNGAWTIDSATGTFQDVYNSLTATVTGIASPVSSVINITNDNLIYPGQATYVDASGLTFATNSGDVTVSYLNGGYEQASHFGLGAGVFTLTAPAAAAPEASTWAMMISGFAVLGFFGYRQSRKGAATALAV
jgi:hypothetical protein